MRINSNPLNRLLISLLLRDNSVGNPLADVWVNSLLPEQTYCVLLSPFLADLKPWVSNFTYPGVHDFSQLALDANRNQLIVGAR